MDPDDPIQRFLQTTGWTCEDLLEKLQKYRASKDPLGSQQTSTQSNKTDNIELKDPLSNLNQDDATTNISDPDDGEKEVNGVDSGNTDEIVEDINGTDKNEDENCSITQNKSNATDTSDVTEVRVVEVSDDDLDKEDEQQENILNPEEIESLEKYQKTDEFETITIETESEKPQENKINYVEIDPRQKIKLRRLSIKPTQQGQYSKFKISKVTAATVESLINSNKLIPEGKQNIFRPKIVIKKTLQKVDNSLVTPKSSSSFRPVIINKTDNSLVVLRQNATNVKSPLQSIGTTTTGSIATDSKCQNVTRVAKSSTESVRTSILSPYTTNPITKCQNTTSLTRFVKSPAEDSAAIPKSVLSLKKNDSSDLTQSVIKYKIFANDLKHISSPKVTGCEDSSPTNFSNKDLSKSPTLFRLGNGGGIIKNDKIEKTTKESDVLTPIKIPENPMKTSHLSDTDDAKIYGDVPSELELTPTETSVASNNILSVESEGDDVEENNRSKESFENIRNNLKLQLNSLRTKKKSQFLETTSTKVIDNIQRSKKLSLLESIEDSKKNIPSEKNMDKNLYTQTNELGLVISNVEGGVEIEDTEGSELKLNEINSNITDNDDCLPDNRLADKDIGTVNDTENIKVLDEIRKIINKQKLPPKLSISKSNDNSLCFQKRMPKSDEDKKMDISCENSQTSFTEVEEKSPFISDSLDEFLTADSKLNISYQVPKLGAEEGLKNITEESPLILKRIEQIKENDETKEDKTKMTPTVKAKTVAQKRRLLEKERRKELRKVQKKKLKELEERVKEVSKEMEEIKVKNNNKNKSTRSYLLYNDKKIWLKSTISNKCFAKINCSKQLTNLNNRKKLSLLQQSYKKQNQIEYRPGPLCKKRNLQVTEKDKWDTQMVQLPKLYLEVFPKQGKPFCNTIVQRLNQIIGGELDDNKIEFALSAVKCKNYIKEETIAPLKFPLEYHNKVERILTRRPRKTKKNEIICESPMKSIDKKGTTDVVADVVEDLIRYVEIKVLAPTLIKEDDVKVPIEDCLNNSSPIKENISVIRKPHKRRTKVENELLRLSCKVVNVEIEESKDEKVYCSKPYCELGCVCKSLKCDYILPRHCQKPECMFKCTCPKEKSIIYDKITFPDGTNLLSEDTVNRIEDEAKKNLAKVEKEFTQTVIHTNDKTIVVGVGDRTKTRRAARTPAKFSDFVSLSEILQENEEIRRKRCVVSLHKLNLSGIIPYCLTHNMYNCFCKGLEVVPQIDKILSNQTLPENQEFVKKRSLIDLRSRKVRNLRIKNESKKIYKYPSLPDPLALTPPCESDNSSQDDLWTPNEHIDISPKEFPKRPVRNVVKRKISNIDDAETLNTIPPKCARVIELPKKYKRSLQYTPNIYQDDFVNNISEEDLFRMNLPENIKIKFSKADLLKQSLIKDKEILDSGKNKTKRKQTLESREDDTPIFIESEKDPAIQRRKKVPLQIVENKMRAVFEGEVIIDRRNIDLLRVMGPRTVAEGYARLLPWTALIKGFVDKSICIWSMIDQPSRLLINKSDKKCPKNYMAIDKLPTSTEIITWIKQKKLPPDYEADSFSFILRETKNNFEICGICTKNVARKSDQTETSKNDKEKIAEEKVEKKIIVEEKVEKKVIEEKVEQKIVEENVDKNEQAVDKNVEIFYHKDLSGVERFFSLHKKKYETILLVEDVPDLIETKLPDIRVALPSTSDGCKWRMLFLNSDFTFLFFGSISYSIRYTDLLAMGNYAKTSNCTIRLENKGMGKNYKHHLFGIYFEPGFSDRIFIGPYIQDCDSEDIDTLRYINQSLVSTKSFNLMRGKGDYKCGHWFVETSEPTQSLKPSKSAECTIDLTSDNELESIETVREITKNPPETVDYYPYAPKIIHNEQEIKIIDAPPRKPEDFNRYIITNIPHFGYLGAYMHPHGEIDVSWPFENKLLRFSSESAATTFLQDRFSSLLQSVPETFKINIIVALNIDLKVYHPIDSAVLNGHYICGDFGYMNILETSDRDCVDKVGMSKEEVLKLFSKRAQNFVKSKLETLSYLLQIPKNENGCFDLSLILRKAAEEIHLQIRKERENRIIKNTLFLKKRENALKLHKLLSKLPEDQRNIENMKFRAILDKTEELPIVINDSDDEVKKQASSNAAIKDLPATSSKAPMKSILKPLVTVPVGKDNILFRMDLKNLQEKDPLDLNTSPVDEPKYIPGVKLVKNSHGGFVLVKKDIKTSSNNLRRPSNSDSSENADEVIYKQNHSNKKSAKVTPIEKRFETAGVVVPLKTVNVSDNKNNSEVIELDDDDVIPIENEPMIIDLDDFPSDDD
ncbi:uncharacterized protein LOC130900325 isoform X2 [Diorhabda carinulata]|nr:uncharacterized protein LOC130900325 isoform X2 [Diorhabda carinulata]